MFEVEKIMTRNVVTVNPETPIYEAAKILIENRISGMPVVDGENNIVGIISEKDILKLLSSDDPGDHEKSVKDFMTKDAVCFSQKESAVRVCEFFLKVPVRRVPIVEGKKLLGIVSRRDIIKLILNIRNRQ